MTQAGITTDGIELNVAGSTPTAAYVARPASAGPQAGLLVFEEAYPVNSHIRNVTDQFAEQGDAGIAAEMFHRAAPAGFEGNSKNFPSGMPHDQASTNEAAEAGVRAACAWLPLNSQVQADAISGRGILYGPPGVFSGEPRVFGTERCLVPWRRNRSGPARPGGKAAWTGAADLGRLG